MMQALRLIVVILIMVSGFICGSFTLNLLRNFEYASRELSRSPILFALVAVSFTFLPAFLLNLKLLRRRVRVDDDILDDSQKDLRAPEITMATPRWMYVVNFIYSISTAAVVFFLISESFDRGSSSEDNAIMALIVSLGILTVAVTMLNSFPSLKNESSGSTKSLPDEF